MPYCCQVQSKLRSQFLGPLCLWQCLYYLSCYQKTYGISLKKSFFQSDPDEDWADCGVYAWVLDPPLQDSWPEHWLGNWCHTKFPSCQKNHKIFGEAIFSLFHFRILCKDIFSHFLHPFQNILLRFFHFLDPPLQIVGWSRGKHTQYWTKLSALSLMEPTTGSTIKVFPIFESNCRMCLSQISKCICPKLENVFVSNCNMYLSQIDKIEPTLSSTIRILPIFESKTCGTLTLSLMVCIWRYHLGKYFREQLLRSLTSCKF